MIDREKVIKDLEDYRDKEFVKEGITVFDNDPRYRKMIINNALALLKAQEETISELISIDKAYKELEEKIDSLQKENDDLSDEFLMV